MPSDQDFLVLPPRGSEKLDLVRRVAEYFERRREDE